MVELDIKKIIHKGLHLGGIYHVISRLYCDHVRILMYHRFSQNKKNGYTSAQELEDQLVYLKKRFIPTSLNYLADLYMHRRQIPNNLVAVTVDDGYEDFYLVAYPIFLKHRIPVSVFVCTDFIDQKDWIWTDKIKYLFSHSGGTDSRISGVNGDLSQNDFFEMLYKMPPEEINNRIEQLSKQFGLRVPRHIPLEHRPLSWSQIREVSSNGIEIGAHGASHRILSNIPYDEAQKDILLSKQRIEEEVGAPTFTFCYPNGNSNDDIVQIVRDAGFKCALTTEYGFNNKKSNQYLLKRVGVGNLPFVYYVQSLSGLHLIRKRFSNKF